VTSEQPVQQPNNLRIMCASVRDLQSRRTDGDTVAWPSPEILTHVSSDFGRTAKGTGQRLPRWLNKSFTRR
jgi:hypothetical protein